MTKYAPDIKKNRFCTVYFLLSHRMFIKGVLCNTVFDLSLINFHFLHERHSLLQHHFLVFTRSQTKAKNRESSECNFYWREITNCDTEGKFA